MQPANSEHRRRETLAVADAMVVLVDAQLNRLETLLEEVRNTERFVERRYADRGRTPERRS